MLKTNPNGPVLTYRLRSLYLLLCYLPFLIIPWVLHCILAVRPLSISSYLGQIEPIRTSDLPEMVFSMFAVRVLSSVSAVLAVPATSALLAHGAVVYSQRRRSEQSLNLAQTLTLADRRWSDVPWLLGINQSGTGNSQYLWLAAGLLFISRYAPVFTHQAV